MAEPILESHIIHLAVFCASHCWLWFPDLRSHWVSKLSRVPDQLSSLPLLFTHPPNSKVPKLATYKAQHGDTDYPLLSAGARDRETLSGTAGWESVVGPCSAFLLQEMYKTDKIHQQQSFPKAKQPESYVGKPQEALLFSHLQSLGGMTGGFSLQKRKQARM